MTSSAEKGFTLIELMIALAIVAILTMIAYPSYQSSIEKGRRTEARAALTEIAALQEKFFFKDNQYSASINNLFGATATREGHYNLTLDVSASGTGCGADGECFEISATAVGSQAADTTCQTFTLNNVGLKVAIDNNSADTTAQCW